MVPRLLFIAAALLVDAASETPAASVRPGTNVKDAGGSTAQLFVIDGTGGTGNEVDAFEIPAGTSVKVKALPFARYAHGTATVSNLIYAIGGYNSSGYLAAVHTYIPSPVDDWFAAMPMTTPRGYLGVCSMDG